MWSQAKCDIKGVDLGEAISNEDKVDGAECQKLIDLFADSDDTYTVKESGWALGCATDCHVVIKATVSPLTRKRSKFKT